MAHSRRVRRLRDHLSPSPAATTTPAVPIAPKFAEPLFHDRSQDPEGADAVGLTAAGARAHSPRGR